MSGDTHVKCCSHPPVKEFQCNQSDFVFTIKNAWLSCFAGNKNDVIIINNAITCEAKKESFVGVSEDWSAIVWTVFVASTTAYA